MELTRPSPSSCHSILFHLHPAATPFFFISCHSILSHLHYHPFPSCFYYYVLQATISVTTAPATPASPSARAAPPSYDYSSKYTVPSTPFLLQLLLSSICSSLVYLLLLLPPPPSGLASRCPSRTWPPPPPSGQPSLSRSPPDRHHDDDDNDDDNDDDDDDRVDDDYSLPYRHGAGGPRCGVLAAAIAAQELREVQGLPLPPAPFLP